MMNRLFDKYSVAVLLFVLLMPFLGDCAIITYQYDRLNRLTSILYGDGTRIAYVYDPAGNRLSRTISGNNITLKGDINGDELVTLADAIQGLQVLSGLKPAGIRPGYAVSGSDADGNQRIGLEEAIYILQKVAAMR